MRRILETTAALSVLAAGAAFGHGDVAPQAVNVETLPELDEEWLYENPYRGMGEEVWAEAVRIGRSGYTQNCARCHGLEAVSGGLAPDLRYLEAEEFGDEWFVERFRHGYTQNGTTKMPAFGELLGQEAAWAIRTYIETRPDDGAIEEHGVRLAELRDVLGSLNELVAAGEVTVEQVDVEIATVRAVLDEIAAQIETGSGAPRADSPASQAAAALVDAEGGVQRAFEVLTVGLSNAE